MRNVLLGFGTFLFLTMFATQIQFPQVSGTLGILLQSGRAFGNGFWRGLSGNLAVVNYYPHNFGRFTVYVPKVYQKTLAHYDPHHYGGGYGYGVPKSYHEPSTYHNNY